jgi:hypothetical protein
VALEQKLEQGNAIQAQSLICVLETKLKLKLAIKNLAKVSIFTLHKVTI